MESRITRRKFAGGVGVGIANLLALPNLTLFAESAPDKEIAPFRTPYKYEKLVLAAPNEPEAFDCKSVDDPFVFRYENVFYMLYIGFDGTGYQTGMAKSEDLMQWKRVACVARRDPESKYTRYNIALSCIVREDQLTSPGKLKKVRRRYLGAWNAYPNAGYEVGAAVIGLAWSDNLLHWELTEPILFPKDGAPWEHGGLYRPNLIEHDGTFYLYYNAKTDPAPKHGWHEQTGVDTSRDLKHWTRYAGNPILRNGGPNSCDTVFASNPFVVQHRNLWGMYYYGLDRRGVARDLLALGHDPFHFTKASEIMINVGPPGSVDETYAHKPGVICHDGVLYHFCCAVSGRWPHEVRGISVARSKPW
jgi:Glycosyl hydrolases family 32 N-terminal domain